MQIWKSDFMICIKRVWFETKKRGTIADVSFDWGLLRMAIPLSVSW